MSHNQPFYNFKIQPHLQGAKHKLHNECVACTIRKVIRGIGVQVWKQFDDQKYLCILLVSKPVCSDIERKIGIVLMDTLVCGPIQMMHMSDPTCSSFGEVGTT